MRPAAATLPTVSVIIPCREEERFIAGSLREVLSGSYPPDRMEVLVVDGRSRDGTRRIVGSIAARDPRVRLLDNPRGTTPAALNIGVRAARGQVIVRIDAHTSYPPEYVEAMVRALDETGADMVGARPENIPTEGTAMNLAISIATGAAFGTSSPFRLRRRSGPVDAVPYGCWRRELFERIGLFDERLLRNQDNEHSSRILAAGGRVHQVVDVRIRYHNRPSLRALARQASQTGMWNAFTHRLHPYTFRWRHFLPGVFFVGVLLAFALALFGVALDRRLALAGAALLAPYALVNTGVSLWLAAARRHIGLAPRIALAFWSYHLTYGYGIAKGWLLVASGRWRRRLGKEAIRI